MLALPFGLVAPFALLGIVLLWCKPVGSAPHSRLLVFFALAYALGVVLFFVDARLRLPVVPLVLLLAGYGLREALAPGYWKKGLVLVLLPLCNIGAAPMDMADGAHQHYWTGYAFQQQGLQDSAAHHYRIALQRRPQHEDALLALATLYSDQGQYGEVVQLYRQLLQSDSGKNPVRFLLGNALLQARRYPEALAAFEELAPQHPERADLHGHLGFLYLQTDQPGR